MPAHVRNFTLNDIKEAKHDECTDEVVEAYVKRVSNAPQCQAMNNSKDKQKAHRCSAYALKSSNLCSRHARRAKKSPKSVVYFLQESII